MKTRIALSKQQQEIEDIKIHILRKRGSRIKICIFKKIVFCFFFFVGKELSIHREIDEKTKGKVRE